MTAYVSWWPWDNVLWATQIFGLNSFLTGRGVALNRWGSSEHPFASILHCPCFLSLAVMSLVLSIWCEGTLACSSPQLQLPARVYWTYRTSATGAYPIGRTNPAFVARTGTKDGRRINGSLVSYMSLVSFVICKVPFDTGSLIFHLCS